VAGSWTPEHIDAITREYFRRYQENGGAAAMQYREGIEASQRVTGAAGKENLDRLEKALSEVRPQVASGKSYDQIKTQEAEEAPSGYEPGPSTGAIQNEKPLPRDATKELKQGEEKKKATNESRAKETATATYVDENGDTVKVVVGTDGSVTKKIVSKKQEQTEGGGESEGDGGGNED
jgi:hypothetical protein